MTAATAVPVVRTNPAAIPLPGAHRATTAMPKASRIPEACTARRRGSAAATEYTAIHRATNAEPASSRCPAAKMTRAVPVTAAVASSGRRRRQPSGAKQATPAISHHPGPLPLPASVPTVSPATTAAAARSTATVCRAAHSRARDSVSRAATRLTATGLRVPPDQAVCRPGECGRGPGAHDRETGPGVQHVGDLVGGHDGAAGVVGQVRGDVVLERGAEQGAE